MQSYISPPGYAQIATKETFEKELKEVEIQYQEVTGEEMTKFYRPPQGKYSESNLQMAKEMGYQTFFWSLAYVNWYETTSPPKTKHFKNCLAESTRRHYLTPQHLEDLMPKF